jgi:hypothetical protein
MAKDCKPLDKVNKPEDKMAEVVLSADEMTINEKSQNIVFAEKMYIGKMMTDKMIADKRALDKLTVDRMKV